jgi:nucleoside-diphosphate-sugar epimerase
LSISVLIRKAEQAALYSSKGTTPIIFNGLEDVEHLKRVASEHDIVLHAADSTSPAAAEALIQGLADNQSSSKTRKYFIHTSGTSSLGDRPVSKRLIENREFSDRNDDIYSYMKQREAIESYAQRATDIQTVEVGEKTSGVNTIIVKAPIIYGRGTGLFNQKSFHIPILIKGALAAGHAQYVGDGAGIWDYVHVVDLAELFELNVAKILRGETENLPSGKKGIYFANTLRHSWKELAEGIAKSCYKAGGFESPKTQALTLEEAADIYTGRDEHIAEVGLASKYVYTRDILTFKVHANSFLQLSHKR